jgi:hypothetical protein
METTHETIHTQRPFIAGFWLITALPICAAILIPILEFLKPDESLEFPIVMTVLFYRPFCNRLSLGPLAGSAFKPSL